MSYLERRDAYLDDSTDGETKSQPKAKEAAAGVITIDSGKGDSKYEINPDINIDKAYDYLKKTPEALSMVNAIVEDVMGFGVEFEYIGREDTSGVRKIQDAKKFWKQGFHLELERALIDELIAGRSYLYINQVTRSKMKSKISEIIGNQYDFNSEKKAELAKKMAYKATVEDEDKVGFRGVQHVPASTVEHVIDENGNIEDFVQEIINGGDEIHMDPDNVVHLSNMPLNGETYGFTPLNTIFSEMALLGNVKDYQGRFFKNAGITNKLFKLEDEGPNSQRYKHLMKTLKKFRKNTNQHRDLALTGNVEVTDLNSIDSEMDFKDLSEYVTRVITMAWGVPPSRIGIDVSGDNSARSASLNQQGYYKKIRRKQEKLATILNNELFEPLFGVNISFKNPDIKTEIKMADRDLRKTEVVKQMVSMGMWGSEKAMDYMNVEPKDLPNDMNPTDINEEKFREAVRAIQSEKNNLLGETSINQDRADEEAAQDKRTSANNNQ